MAEAPVPLDAVERDAAAVVRELGLNLVRRALRAGLIVDLLVEGRHADADVSLALQARPWPSEKWVCSANTPSETKRARVRNCEGSRRSRQP